MEKFIIAGLKTKYHVRGNHLRAYSNKYRADFDDSETDISIDIPEEYLERKTKEIKELSYEQHEYVWTGMEFYKELLEHNGLMVHSSCVEKDGFAYLFSANCGTGKSTHTHLWLKNLSGTRIINDDKPALILEDDVWYACGTPFSGKTKESENVKVPVRAITFLERSNNNSVKRISVEEAIKLLFQQTIKPSDKNRAIKLLENVDKLLRKVPVFKLECNMDDEAAVVSYESIERLIKDEN